VWEKESEDVRKLASEPIATVTVIARWEERANSLARPSVYSLFRRLTSFHS
jgi:hypothetical protein